MTVALGTLNGLVFYANVVFVNKSTFLKSSNTFFLMIIKLLNTNLSLDICFYKDMDQYGKTWLRLAFPLYLIFLVIITIMVTKYSSRCAHLLGRRNPVATLATLILFSYTNFLSAVINVFTFRVLNYPDNSHVLVWSHDANVKYLQGKHIPLFLAAIIIFSTGLIYTCLLYTSPSPRDATLSRMPSSA